MARSRIQLEQQKDFTGGLNLKDDPVDLTDAETYDLQNVDIGRRGGFCIRRGIAKFINNNTSLTAPRATHTFVNSSGTRRIVAVSAGYRVQYWDGTNWVELKAATGGTFDAKLVEMRNIVFIINAAAIVHKWDGVAGTTTALTAPGFNDDLAAPNEGNFLQCHTAAVHKESMWVGNIVNDPDGAVNRSSRIRWSHPGKPEDWRTNDFIDLDQDDENGEIRAMVPFGDRLIVFKDHAVYAIHGAPPAGLSAENLTKKVGASFNGAVAVTEGGIFFWDSGTGVWFYDGSKFEWVFERIFPLVDDRVLSPDLTLPQSLAFHNQRLYCAIRWQGAPYDSGGGADVGLIYDPYAGKTGAWMVHVKQQQLADGTIINRFWPKALHVHEDSNGTEHLLGSPSNLAWILEVDTPEKFDDDLLQTSPATHSIPAYYTTRWFNANSDAIKKRWKRPVVVVRGGFNQSTLAEVLGDYDPSHVMKTFSLDTVIPSETVQQSFLELNAAGEIASTPDDAALDITGNITIGADIDPDALTTIQTLVSKFATAGNQRSYMLQVNATAFPRLVVSPDGTAAAQLIINSTTPLPDSGRRTVWVEFVPNDGLGNRVTTFYTSSTLSGTKTLLSQITTPAVTSIFSGTAPVQVGAFDTSTEPLVGRVYAAEIRSGSISGTIVAQPEFFTQPAGTLVFTDTPGRVWTLSGGAAIVSEDVVVSDEGIWDTSLWDSSFWARESNVGHLVARSEILRGAPLGSGVARALRFKNTTPSQDWCIHGLTMKYIPRTLRN